MTSARLEDLQNHLLLPKVVPTHRHSPVMPPAPDLDGWLYYNMKRSLKLMYSYGLQRSCYKVCYVDPALYRQRNSNSKDPAGFSNLRRAADWQSSTSGGGATPLSDAARWPKRCTATPTSWRRLYPPLSASYRGQWHFMDLIQKIVGKIYWYLFNISDGCEFM